jgi:molybdate transport system substrate-binding protein
MLRRFKVAVLICALSISGLFAKDKETILIYCGITMVNPVKEIATILEKDLDVKIVMTQGGSADLFNALKNSNTGDIYIPGEERYIKEYKPQGYFEEHMKNIGYNQAAIFVQKGNPSKVQNLKDLLRTDISTMLCDYNTGSIGKMTKTILENYGGKKFFEDAYLNAVEVGTDSRNINAALNKKSIDLAVNWKSTITFADNKNTIEMIEIDEKYAPKMHIPAILLKSSKNKDIAKKIIDYMAAKDGQAIMKKYGFVD